MDTTHNLLVLSHALEHFNIRTYFSPDHVWICCPFHEDGRPSLSVNEEYYRCWSCGAHGSLLRLVAHYMQRESEQQIDEFDALFFLSSIRKEKKHEKSNFEQATFERKARLNEQEAILFSKVYLESLKAPNWEMLDHPFLEKGYHPQTLKHFSVKLDPSSMRQIVIPIKQNKALKGFASRAESDTIDPKYLYNEGFKRSKVVGGTLRKGEVMIVEGYADMMRTYQNLYKNVACLLGCFCSPEQEAYIRLFASHIVIATDNDEAGNRAAKRLKKQFEDLGTYRFPIPKVVKDPGAMNKRIFDLAYCAIA